MFGYALSQNLDKNVRIVYTITMAPKTLPPRERFEAKVNYTTTCWLWTGALVHGYGLFFTGKWLPYGGQLNVYAHRWNWEEENGPVPDGLVLDHYICDTPACVRPSHVRPTTQQDNLTRSGRTNAQKKSCPQGHPYSPENTHVYMTKRGTSRICKKCKRQKDAQYRLSRRLKLGVKG